MLLNTLITTSKVVKLAWSRTFNGLDLYSYSPCTIDRIRSLNVRPMICNPELLELPLFMMPTERNWSVVQDYFEETILPWAMNVEFLPTGYKSRIAISEYLEFCGSDPIKITDDFCNLKDESLIETALEKDDWRKFTVTDFMNQMRLIVCD